MKTIKRFITFALRGIIFLLLGFLIYQKYTGTVVDVSYIANPIGNLGDKLKNNIVALKNIVQGSSDRSELSKANDPQVPPLHTTAEFSGAKADLQRNQEFSYNLVKNTFVLKPQVGKGELFVARSGSADHTNDQIVVTLGSQTTIYPAFYNAHNATVAQQGSGSTGETYQATGLIVMNGDDYYFYYPVISSNGKQLGIIASARSGLLSASESVIPFLFYKGHYFFTKQEGDIKNMLYSFQNGMFTAVMTGELGGVSVEKDAIAMHNKTTNQIILISLPDYQVRKTLVPQKTNINYASFMLTGSYIWVKYQDNLSGSVVYEKQIQ